MTYSAATMLMCDGKGSGSLTEPDVTIAEVGRIEAIAHELHRRSGWHSPPDPLALAGLAGVRMSGVHHELGLPQSFGATSAIYWVQTNPRDTGLAAAFALASSLVLQRDLPWSEVFRWRLATELLVPSWSLDDRTADTLVTEHPNAPNWLVRQRVTHRLGTVDQK